MPTRRQERVNARLVQEVSAILRTLKDSRLGFITVIRAEVSPDMRHANLFVSIYGDDAEVERSMEALQSATGLVRKMLGKTMQMKYTPEVQFRQERGIRIADEMNYLISEARASDPNPGPAPEITSDVPEHPDCDSDAESGNS